MALATRSRTTSPADSVRCTNADASPAQMAFSSISASGPSARYSSRCSVPQVRSSSSRSSHRSTKRFRIARPETPSGQGMPVGEVEDVGEHGVVPGRVDDASLVRVGDAALVGREEARTDPDAFGAEHQRRGDPATVGDPTGRDHRHGRDGVDDGGNERHRRDPAGVTAGLGALRGHDVDAGRGRASRLRRRCGPGTARARRRRAPSATNGVGSANECAMTRTPSRNATAMSSRGVRQVADEPDAERTIGELTRDADLFDQPVHAADRRAADQSETARFGRPRPPGGRARHRRPSARSASGARSRTSHTVASASTHAPSGRHRTQVRPQRPHSRREPPQLLEVRAAQLAERRAPSGRQAQTHDAMIDGVGTPLDEPGAHRAVDETRPRCGGAAATRRRHRRSSGPAARDDRGSRAAAGAARA